jgi:hypothetical protein
VTANRCGARSSHVSSSAAPAPSSCALEAQACVLRSRLTPARRARASVAAESTPSDPDLCASGRLARVQPPRPARYTPLELSCRGMRRRASSARRRRSPARAARASRGGRSDSSRTSRASEHATSARTECQSVRDEGTCPGESRFERGERARTARQRVAGAHEPRLAALVPRSPRPQDVPARRG